MKIFHLDCSVNDDKTSITRRYTKKIVDLLEKKYWDISVHYVDLTKEKIPFIDKDYEMAMFKDPASRTEKNEVALNSFDIRSFVDADIYVIGIPGYFFNVPASFKNWQEHLFRIGTTISTKWEGLLKNKKMYVVSAWGGVYTNTTIETSFEHLVTQGFNLLGIEDITIYNIYRDKETKSDNMQEVDQALIEDI